MMGTKEKEAYVKRLGEFIAEDTESGVVSIEYAESGYMNRYASVSIEHKDGSYTISPINDRSKGNIAKSVFDKVYG